MRLRNVLFGISIGGISLAGLGEDTARQKQAAELFAAGKWEVSQAVYEEVLTRKLGPEGKAEVLMKIGYCQERQDRWMVAIATYRRVLDSPDSPETRKAQANLRTGYAMRRNGEDREAIPFLLAAAENEAAGPNIRAEGYLYTAWAHGVLDEPEKAMANFRKVETVPEAHGNYVATAYLGIGRLLKDEGKFEEALAAFRKIAAFDPVAATNRSRARIYILECEALLAGDNPFHIEPCVIDVTGTTARLFWVSQGKEPPEAKLRVVSGGEENRSFPVSVEPIANTTCHKHSADISRLTPGAEYRYRAFCGNTTAAGSFRTAPKRGTGFSFSVIGDTQSYREDLQPLLDALGEEKTDFVIHVGDLVDRGDLWGEWKAGFFDPGRSYLRHSHLRPVFGNHDGGPFYPAFFKSPEGRLYYSFDWGDAHFVVLDSYGAGSGGAGRAAQLAWLEKDLSANDKPWTIVALHVPMVVTRSGVPCFGKDDFLPVLEKHGVDVVFSGHHPLYRRYRPIGNPAILHVTSGGGGGPVGGFVPSPLLAKGVDANHYCRVEVAPDRLTLTANHIEGEVIDRFELSEKNGDWRTAWPEESIDAQAAAAVLPIYQELLTDRTFELVLTLDEIPDPGERVVLKFDLDSLPRGPLDRNRIPPGAKLTIRPNPEGPWTIDPQVFRLEDREFEIAATAPVDGARQIAGGRIVPGIDVVLELSTSIGSEYGKFSTKARLVRKEEREP